MLSPVCMDSMVIIKIPDVSKVSAIALKICFRKCLVDADRVTCRDCRLGSVLILPQRSKTARISKRGSPWISVIEGYRQIRAVRW